MRYQQYKNRMLKIRRVIDFFYRFRFVFAGAIAVIVAGSITLDATRGNITSTTDFKVTYTYGEEISYSGSAFMSKVTYEFRKVGSTSEDDWSEETPIYPGQYEARAKSEGSHGYKYSEESTFEIKPYETTFSIKNDAVNFGDDSPELQYTLLPGDHLNDDYIVDYADKTKTKTTASINANSLRIYNKDNLDVTSCYAITTTDKEIDFIPAKLNFTFIDPEPFTYTGDETHPFSANDYQDPGPIYYDAEPVITGDIITDITTGSKRNSHTIAIIDSEGNDYTDNYDINIVRENNYTVNKAPTIVISSPTLEKRYDNQPFDASNFTISNLDIQNLLDIHEITDVEFAKKDAKTCEENGDNTFTFNIRNKSTHEIINPTDFYQGAGVITNPGRINIKPIPVTINTKSINHIFDNTEVKGYLEGVDVIDYTVNDEVGLLFGEDFIKVDDYKAYTRPGYYSNVYTCNVYRKMMVDSVLTDVNVSSNYDITYTNGGFNIVIEPIVVKFDGRNLEYNGYPQIVYQNDNHGSITSGSLPAGWTLTATVYNNLNDLGSFTMTDVLANEQGYSATEEQVRVIIWDEHGDPVQDSLNPSENDIYKVDTNKSHNNDSNCDITFVFEESRLTKADLYVTVTDFDPLEYNHQTLEERLNLKSRVSSVGLKGDDEVVVSFSDSAQKKIKNARETSYAVGLNVEVQNEITGEPTGGNYNIHFNRDEPVTSSVKINRKNVTIHTPDIEMVYADSSTIPQKDIDFSSVKVFDEHDNPIDGLKVTFNKDKMYTSSSSLAGPCAFNNIEEDDLIIYDASTEEIYHNVYNQTGALDNYNITLVNDGIVNITPRYLEIYQKDDESKDHIFYDGQNHGVLNGSLEIDYTREDSNQEIGILSSKYHVLNFTNPKSTNVANEPNHATLYGDGLTDVEKTAYFGTKIYKNNDPTKDMTSNYDIQYRDDYIRINIIKKKITIESISDKKVFDGAEFYKLHDWVEIKDVSEDFIYSVTRYDDTAHDYVETSLDEGDVLQVRKTNTTIFDDSRNVGNHTNEFDWRVIDTNGIPKADGWYNHSKSYGTLEVKKLYIDFLIDHRNKEYDSNNITFPNGMAIDGIYDGYEFDVTENSREEGLLLSYRTAYDAYDNPISFDKETFESNFIVRASIYRGAYPKFYLANSDDPENQYYQAYKFTINTSLRLRFNGSASDEPTTNVQLGFTNSILNYRVTKPRIELKTTKITSDQELRILIGTLRANDTLYFGTEKYVKKPKKWNATFIRANVHIYRNDNPEDEVTDCYNIVM